MSISSAYRQHSTTRSEPVSGYRLSTTPTRLRAPLASIHNVRREINTSTTTPKTQYSANAWKPKSEATWLDAPLEKTVRKKTKKTMTTTTTRQALPPLKLPLRRISPGAAATAAAAAEEDESNIATRKHASASAAQQRARAAAAQRITRLEAEVEHFKTTLKVVTQKSVKLEADLEASRTLHARASMAAGARYAALAHACRAEAEAAEANAATDAATAAPMPVRTYVSSPRLQPIDSTAEADAESPSGVLTLRAPTPTPTPTPTPRRTLVAIKVGPGPLGAEIGTLLLKSASRVVVEIVSVLPDSQLARLGAREGDWVEWIGTRRLDLQGIFDPDGDGKVTESELAGALATIRTTFGVEQRDFNEDAPIENARQVAKRMMKRFDADENGTLEPAELLELLNEVVLKRLVALLATERPLALRLSRCAIVD